MTDLVVRDNNLPQQTFFKSTPQEMVVQAAVIATTLADVIEKQQLYSMVQGKKYVRVEGWQTLGSMLGILPRETKVIEHEDGSYEAFVELVNCHTGMVVGGGSALCGMDEKRWRGADRYARRSMAITRATGKAYRLSFGWIMTMAGYEATPAEEMKTEVELYTGEAHQKRQLFSLILNAGIKEEAQQKEIANAMFGKPMRDLDKQVINYIENPL